MEEALAVQVLQPPGDVQGQADAQTPRQVHVTAQQLLQVPTVDVLDHQEYIVIGRGAQSHHPQRHKELIPF